LDVPSGSTPFCCAFTQFGCLLGAAIAERTVGHRQLPISCINHPFGITRISTFPRSTPTPIAIIFSACDEGTMKISKRHNDFEREKVFRLVEKSGGRTFVHSHISWRCSSLSCLASGTTVRIHSTRSDIDPGKSKLGNPPNVSSDDLGSRHRGTRSYMPHSSSWCSVKQWSGADTAHGLGQLGKSISILNCLFLFESSDPGSFSGAAMVVCRCPS
jgi:hypothetical protein